ncbi:MAG TPA: hypothetical protein QF720_05890 [Nitrospinota bacterium]|nr:hypothetical protein [Nitrospinota bacterium]|tara:strand:+ start:63289 stop:63591 length:303 start_codon:yes stop_codon:yes gene_type:complete
MSEKKNQEFLESMELIIEYAKKIANGENIEITKAEWNNGKETNPDRVAHILTLEAGTRRSEVFMRRDSIEGFPSDPNSDKTRSVIKGMIIHIHSQQSSVH